MRNRNFFRGNRVSSAGPVPNVLAAGQEYIRGVNRRPDLPRRLIRPLFVLEPDNNSGVRQ